MELTLPAFDYNVKKQDDALWIFDIIRKKYVKLTPEEWVRQHVIHYLVEHRSYPAPLIAVEKEIDLYGLKKRFDLVCYDRCSEPFLIIECKAPEVALSQAVFDQVFGYNLILAAKYVMITNGISHCCVCKESGKEVCFVSGVPDFPR